jgi:hypothetical protein
MRKLILLASAAAVAATMPALAQAKPGNGHSAHSSSQARSNGHARTDARANARARARTGAAVDRRIDTDRDGIPDYRDRTDNRSGNRYGGAACPPGLANRTPSCVPPGQARRAFRQGQAVPRTYRDYVAYQDLLGRLPESYRDDIPTGDYRYIYRDDQVYVVDARTRLVNRIIDILR